MTPIKRAPQKTLFSNRTRHADADAHLWAVHMHRLREQAAAKRKAELDDYLGRSRVERWVEIVEHIPAEPVVVSPERHRELTERAWIGPTQTNTITGDVSHLRRTLGADGRYVTERIDGPAPAANDALTIAITSSTAGSGFSCESASAPPASGEASPPDGAPAVETEKETP
jgi:hypothetical protein